MRLNLPAYSPYDIRVTLRIVAGLLVWKTLSSDFSNLVELGRDPRPVFWASSMQVEWVVRALTRAAEYVLVSEMAVRGVQIGMCLALVAAVAVLNRWLLIAVLAPVWAFHCYASFYLAPTFGNELCLCYLFLAALWPGSWDGLVRGGRDVSRPATTFGCAVLTMISTWYLFAGISKLLFDVNWVANVHLEHLLPTFMIWGDAVPYWHGIAERVHEVFVAAPWLGTMAAGLVLASELLFPLVVVSRWARRILIPVTAGLHFVFFLSVGTLFLTCIVLLLATFTPWRRLGRSVTAVHPAGDGRFQARGYAVMAVVLSLHTLCAVKTRNYYPVVNWAVFGWRYSDMSTPADIYRIGYRDPTDGQVKSVPHHRGGFLDYRFVSYCKYLAAEYFKAESDADRARIAHRARNLLAALRPVDSNRWLLGPFAHPNHGVYQMEPADVSPTGEFYFLKGRGWYSDHRIVKEWDRIEPIEARSGPEREK